MDVNHFRQITIPFLRKAELLHALVRFIVSLHADVLRGDGFNKQFVEQSPEPAWLKDAATVDPWLLEHINRVFWICCELGLLEYRYPYPQRGQLYRPTRMARLIARLPKLCAVIFVTIAFLLAVTANPIKRFARIRNVVTIMIGAVLWWRQQEMSAYIVTISIFAGVISTWIVSFFSGSEGVDA
jgi:hypothetical protein